MQSSRTIQPIHTGEILTNLASKGMDREYVLSRGQKTRIKNRRNKRNEKREKWLDHWEGKGSL